MLIPFPFKKSVLCSLAILMSACAVTPADITKVQTGLEKDIDSGFSKSKSQRRQEGALTKVDGNFVGGKAVELPYSASLPPIFFQKIVINPSIRGYGSIGQAANNITLASGIPTRVNPDLFLEDKIEESKALGRAVILPQAQNQQIAGANKPEGAQNISETTIKRNVPLEYSGQLIDYLNMVASSSGVEWTYDDGAIQFSRFYSKVFYLKSSPGEIAFNSSMAKKGGKTDFTSDTSAGIKAGYNIWKQIEASIRSVLSLKGKMTVNEASGSITVVDYRENVNRAQKIIERENDSLVRQVSVDVRTVNVQVDESTLINLNLNMVWNALSSGTGDNGTTTGSSAFSQAGTMGGASFGVGSLGPFRGSTVNINNLNSIGKILSSETTNAVTTNRVPVMIGKFSSQWYIDSATPATVSTSGVVTAGAVTSKELTTGSFIHMVPTISENNSVLLNLSVDKSNLDSLVTQTNGTGATQTTIQLPKTSGTKSAHNVNMAQNESLILMGVNSDNSTGGNSYGFTGVGTQNEKIKFIQIMIVTPRIMSGV
jgi:type IVB pilus formation R64 PilN family outer membrane protein